MPIKDVLDGLCCKRCSRIVDTNAPGWPRLCEDCREAAIEDAPEPVRQWVWAAMAHENGCFIRPIDETLFHAGRPNGRYMDQWLSMGYAFVWCDTSDNVENLDFMDDWRLREIIVGTFAEADHFACLYPTVDVSVRHKLSEEQAARGRKHRNNAPLAQTESRTREGAVEEWVA